MTMTGVFFTSLILLVPIAAQVQPDPVSWSAVLSGLASPQLLPDIAILIHEIENRGIAFKLDEKALSSIVANAVGGGRNPDEISRVIVACFRSCEECRAHAIAPMTKDELKTLLKWGFSPSGIWDEARIRTVEGIEVNKASADELREAGAKDDLIALLLPDDKMPTIPPEGDYKRLSLRHSITYNAGAPEGWLRITGDFPAKSQSEFLFKHNALFAHSGQGEEATVDLDDSAFNRPAPRNTEKAYVQWDEPVLYNLDQKGGPLRGSAKVKASVEYVEADPDGRNAFRIQITNIEKKPQRCSVTLTWKVRTTPKPPANGTKQE